MKLLTDDELDELPIKVASRTGDLVVLSVYYSDDKKTIWVDVEESDHETDTGD